MKKNKILSVALSAFLTAAAILPVTACSGDGGEAVFFPTVTIAQADGDISYTPTIDCTPNGKITIPLLSGEIYTVSANYEKFITDKYNLGYTDVFAPTPLTVSWECEETPVYYTFDISRNADMSNPESYITFESEVTLKYLFMGYDYYYQISAKYEDKLVKSRIFEFSTEYLPRTVLVDEKVSNTRDWGGYYTVDGKRVKQGIVYRGGALESITEEGKRVMRTELGIKTDLDLRKDGSSTLGYSPLGKDITYLEVGGPWYVGSSGSGIDLLEYREALLTEIRVFANADNFPVYVHCSLGRDRTGTICFLINALLGVGEMDLYRDYEISLMAKTGKDPSNPYSTAAHLVGTAFTNLYNYIKYYEGGKTLQENAEKFMLDIGITQGEINAIRKNMLEEVK